MKCSRQEAELGKLLEQVSKDGRHGGIFRDIFGLLECVKEKEEWREKFAGMIKRKLKQTEEIRTKDLETMETPVGSAEQYEKYKRILALKVTGEKTAAELATELEEQTKDATEKIHALIRSWVNAEYMDRVYAELKEKTRTFESRLRNKAQTSTESMLEIYGEIVKRVKEEGLLYEDEKRQLAEIVEKCDRVTRDLEAKRKELSLIEGKFRAINETLVVQRDREEQMREGLSVLAKEQDELLVKNAKTKEETKQLAESTSHLTRELGMMRDEKVRLDSVINTELNEIAANKLENERGKKELLELKGDLDATQEKVKDGEKETEAAIAKMKAKRTDVEKESKQKEEHLVSLTKKIAEEEGKLKGLEYSIAKAQDKHTEQTKLNSALKTKQEALDTEMAALEDKKIRFTNLVRFCEDKKAELERDLVRVKETLDESRQDCDTKQAEVKSLSEQRAKLIRECQESNRDMEVAKAQRKGLDESIAELETKGKGLRDDVGKLCKERTSLVAEVEGLEKRNADLMNALKNEERLRAQIKENERTVAELSARITRQNAEELEKAERLAQTSKSLERKTKLLTRMERSLGEASKLLKSGLVPLQKALADTRVWMKELVARKDKMLRLHSSYVADYKKKQEAMKHAEKILHDYASSRAQCEKSAAKLKDLTADVARLKAERTNLSKLKTDAESFKGQLEDIRAQTPALRKTAEELKAKITQHQRDLAEYAAKMGIAVPNSPADGLRIIVQSSNAEEKPKEGMKMLITSQVSIESEDKSRSAAAAFRDFFGSMSVAFRNVEKLEISGGGYEVDSFKSIRSYHALKALVFRNVILSGDMLRLFRRPEETVVLENCFRDETGLRKAVEDMTLEGFKPKTVTIVTDKWSPEVLCIIRTKVKADAIKLMELSGVRRTKENLAEVEELRNMGAKVNVVS